MLAVFFRQTKTTLVTNLAKSVYRKIIAVTSFILAKPPNETVERHDYQQPQYSQQGLTMQYAWVLIPCVGTEWWRTLLDVLFVWIGFTIGSDSVYQRIPKPEAVVAAVLKTNAARAKKLELS